MMTYRFLDLRLSPLLRPKNPRLQTLFLHPDRLENSFHPSPARTHSFGHPSANNMESGRTLRSRKPASPVKSPKKATEIESSKKQEGKGGQKSKTKSPTASKAADAINALHQAQEFIAKSTSKDTIAPKKSKRARED